MIRKCAQYNNQNTDCCSHFSRHHIKKIIAQKPLQQSFLNFVYSESSRKKVNLPPQVSLFVYFLQRSARWGLFVCFWKIEKILGFWNFVKKIWNFFWKVFFELFSKKVCLLFEKVCLLLCFLFTFVFLGAKWTPRWAAAPEPPPLGRPLPLGRRPWAAAGPPPLRPLGQGLRSTPKSFS